MVRDPHRDEQGVPREITRVEIERFAGDRVRWTLWSGDVRTHSEISTPETLEGIFRTTELLMSPVAFSRIPK